MPDGSNIAQHLRTFTPNKSPAANSLLEGQISLELGGPYRIWAGVPITVNATGQVLIADSSTTFPDAPQDGQSYARRGIDHSWQAALPIAGETLTGPLILARDPQSPMEAATKEYADSHGGIADAPQNGEVYGRVNLAWAQVLPMFGGTLTGSLTLYGDASHPLDATTLQQVQALIAASAVVGVSSFNGRKGDVVLLANDVLVVMPPSIGLPEMDGTASAGTELEYSAADHVHPTDTSRAPIDSPFFAGTVTLAVNAAQPLEAVPLQQLNIVLGSFLPLSGGVMTGGIDFGSSIIVSGDPTDTSRHITLHDSGYGFGITANRLNYDVPSNAQHIFLAGGADIVRINYAGLTMAPGTSLQLAHDPSSPMEAVTLEYLTTQIEGVTGDFVPLAGGTMTGFLTLSGDPQLPLHAVTKRYVDTGGAGGPYLALAGGHMVGHLFLDGDPTSDLMAVTLQYLNTTVGHYVMLLGDTMQGPLILSGPPTTALQAATMAYVDAVRTLVTGSYLPLSGGTLHGSVYSNSSFTINWSSALTGRSFGFWDTANNYGFGMFAASDTALALGGLDVNGIYNGATWITFTSAGDIYPVPGGTLRFDYYGGDPSASFGGIEFFPGYGGFGVTAGTLNYNWTGVHQFLQGSRPVMNISGGLNMQSPLMLDRDPTANLQAATKHYVDTSVAGYLLLTGGNLTGPLTINATGFNYLSPVSGDQQILTQVWTGPGASAGTFIIAAGGAEPALTGVAAQGSMSSQVAVLYTQSLLRLAGRGHDGAAWSGDQAAIMLKANEQWNATSHGTYLLFSATAKGTLPMVPLMVLNGSGNLLLGTSDPGTDNLTDRLQVNGTAYFSGRVTLSITPTAPSDAVNLQYLTQQITAVQGAYVAKSGDTMTGPLAINATNTTNATLFLRNLTSGANTSWPALVFDHSLGHGSNYIEGDVDGLARWAINLGDPTAETGGNVGSNLTVNRFDDTGHVLNPQPLSIQRSDGTVTIATPLMLGGNATAPLQAVPLQQLTTALGSYLALGGGTMQGGIVFADVWGQSPADVSHHLTLHSGFGIGVSATTRMNYVAGATGQHVFMAGVDIAWIQSGGLWLSSGNDIHLAQDPTSPMEAATKQYADLMLPLAGGTMLNGITFTDQTGAGPADLTHHIRLWTSGGPYGFSITGSRLNIVTPSAAATVFTNSTSGVDIAYFNTAGLGFVGPTTATLGRDPTASMEAVTKQYADGIIAAQGGPFLPISAGPNQALTGDLYLLTRAPTINEQATNKLYVDTADQNLQAQISAVVSGNLVFYGQLDVANDVVHYKYTVNLPDTPMPSPTAVPKGGYIIVVEGGIPPAGNIPPLPLGTPQYVRGDWFISDGEVWIFLPTGLVYFTADAVTTSPPIQGTTDVQATLTWLNTNKLNIAGGTMTGPLVLSSDPTSAMMPVTQQYMQSTLTGSYLALAGGTMIGGISFGSNVGLSATDMSKHILLHAAGYGFDVTTNRLNYNAPSYANHYFSVAGVDILWINQYGVGMSAPLYLPGDPTTATMAATKNYVDGRTPFTTDAPNDANTYGRGAASWKWVPDVRQIGAGAFDLNSVAAGTVALYTITNQTGGANWPSDIWQQCAFLLTGYNAGAGWPNQLLMGPPASTSEAAIWYRNQYNGVWSPWWRIMTAAGGTFTGGVTVNAPLVAGGQFSVANNAQTLPTGTWGLDVRVNYSGGGGGQGDVNFFNLWTAYGGFHWWQMTSATVATHLAWMSPNGDFSTTGDVHTNFVWLSADPTAPTQAATKQYVDAVRTLVTGSYVAKSGDAMSGPLSIVGGSAAWSNSNIGKQLILNANGNNNTALGITDAGGNNPYAICNAGGSFALFGMPPLADGTSNANLWFQVTSTATTFYTSTVTVQNDPTSALHVATKQYVDNRAASGVTSFNTRTGAVTLNNADVIGVLPGSNTAPLMDGGAAAGVSGAWSRGDHVHPSDSSRVAKTGDQMSGELSFGQRLAASPTDLTTHIALYDGWGGFSVTGGIMNIVANNAIGIYPNGATQVATWGSYGLFMNAGNVTLAADPTSALHAATKQYVDTQISSTAGNYLLLTGGTLSGPLQINANLTVNGAVIANSGNLVCNANNGGGNFNGLGLAIIGWNNSNGGAEVDFVNGFTGFANPNSFTWFQVVNSTTTIPLASIGRSGNLTLAGIGTAYDGVTGGGNSFGFAWSGNIEAFVDGNHVATVAGQQWVINNYLALTGGTLSGDLTLTSGRNLNFQAVWTNTGYIHSDNNFGIYIQGLDGAAGDTAIVARNGYGMRIWNDGTVGLNGASVTPAGDVMLLRDPTAALGAATKQYVDTHVAGGVTSFNTRTGAVTLSYADVTGVLPPSATTPVMDGTATAGIANAFSRGDHVHPHDSSKFDVAGGTINGSVQVNGTNLTLGNPTISYTRISVWAQEATAPGYAWYTANNLKWLLAMDQYQESTNNSAQGGNLGLYRYNDDGSFLGTVFTLGRSDGSANFGGPVMLAADPTANLGAATKQYVDTGLGRYLPLAGGSMSGSIAMASYVPISFNSAAASIAATAADAASILGCNFTLNSWNGIGFGPQINYSPFVPVGMYGVAIDCRWGNLAVHGLITASDSRINANNWLQTLRIYRPTAGDQTIEISADTYTPALASTTPVAGGSGNAVNDRLYDAQGNFYTVTAVSGGAVTTIQMDSCRAVSGLPANPVALTACPGFSGTGVTVNLTWTVPQRLVLQHLAGAVTLYGTGGLQLNGGAPGTTVYGPATFVNHASFQAGLDTNAVVAVNPQDTSGCITLWTQGAPNSSYGFAITGSTLNYNTVAGQHNFYSSASLAMSIANNAGSQNISYLPLVANSTLTVASNTTLNGLTTIQTPTSATSAQLFIQPPGNANALESKLRFGGTFAQSSDVGTRFTASLRSGFSAGAWGNEYLDLWINNGGSNDAVSDANQVRIARFTLAGMTLAGNMSLTAGQLWANGANPQINIDGPVGSWRTLQFYTSGSPRWNFQVDTGAESGGNVGSDFRITRWSDAGQPIDVPVSIVRSSGLVSIGNGGATVAGPLTTNSLLTAYAANITTTNNPITLNAGDSSQGHGVVQLSLCYQGTGQYKHWIATRHYGSAPTQLFGNAIDFWLCDGTGPGAFPTNGIWGGAFTAFGLSLPMGSAANPSLNFNNNNYNGDGGTGLYDAGNAIGFSVNSVNKLTINAAGAQYATNTTATLGRDPTANLEAATKQYVDAKSAGASGSTGTAYTAHGTYSFADPGSKYTFISVLLYGGGAGGGGGNYSQAGAGGGGGACVYRIFRRADLTFPVTVIVAAGGAGSAGTITTGAGPGVTGGNTSFGSYLTAYGGGGGLGGGSAGSGQTMGGGGGGAASAGNSSGNQGYAGLPWGTYSAGGGIDNIGPGGGGGGRGSGSGGGNAEWGGGGGGSSMPAVGGQNYYPGATGGSCLYGGAGGGGGGGGRGDNSATYLPGPGGVGGTPGAYFGQGYPSTGGAAGGTVAFTGAGGVGATGAAGSSLYGGGGGGGGGGSTNSHGGNGGPGGAPGGGGGGGGGGGFVSPTSYVGGVGGAGADGAAYIGAW